MASYRKLNTSFLSSYKSTSEACSIFPYLQRDLYAYGNHCIFLRPNCHMYSKYSPILCSSCGKSNVYNQVHRQHWSYLVEETISSLFSCRAFSWSAQESFLSSFFVFGNEEEFLPPPKPRIFTSTGFEKAAKCAEKMESCRKISTGNFQNDGFKGDIYANEDAWETNYFFLPIIIESNSS